MNNELHNAIMLFQKEKGISADVLCEKICLAVSTAAKKEFGIKDGEIICTMDPATYDISIFNRKAVTDDVLDPDTEISVEDAQKYKKGVGEGDTVDVPLKMENLGRIAAQSVKHTIRQNVRNYEHDREYQELQGKNNEIVTAKVLSVNPVTGDATVEIAKTEALLPKKEQLPNETLNVGDFIKIYVVDVIETTKGPKVLLSRTHTGLVRRLFEQEVPEIYDGTVIIKSIAREAGSRTKIAVASKDGDIDAIGACIGARGARVNAIVEMLGGEKIDIIKYSDDPAEFIGGALAPAEIVEVEIPDPEEKSCRVSVPEAQLSLAIGNKGQNARLAARLTGWRIDIKPFYGDARPMIRL